jgi:hypothetical protein
MSRKITSSQDLQDEKTYAGSVQETDSLDCESRLIRPDLECLKEKFEPDDVETVCLFGMKWNY